MLSSNCGMLDNKEIWVRNAFSSFGSKRLFLSDALLINDLSCSRLKKYFGGTEGSKASDNEDPSASLWSSKVFCVQNSPRNTIPEFIQFLDERLEIRPVVAVKESGNILDNQPARSALLDEFSESKEQPTSFSIDALSFAL